MICNKSDEKSIDLCIDYIKNGKILIIPTDTVYGFSGIVSPDYKCDKIIRRIKGRAETKPFIQLIGSPEEIFKYTDDKIPQELLNYWPGPLTIIAKDKRIKNSTNNTTAFRCPGDYWLRKIILSCNQPIYSTSVNRSGFPVLETAKEIVSEFSKEVDLIILDGDKQNALPSTIVKIENNKTVVLRQGAVKIN